MRGFSWLAENLLASEEGLCSTVTSQKIDCCHAYWEGQISLLLYRTDERGSRDNIIGKVAGYELEARVFMVRFLVELEFFLLYKPSTAPLDSTWPPNLLALGACSSGIRRPGRESNHWYNLMSRLRRRGIFFRSPICVQAGHNYCFTLH
jgi:hypothetical protein